MVELHIVARAPLPELAAPHGAEALDPARKVGAQGRGGLDNIVELAGKPGKALNA